MNWHLNILPIPKLTKNLFRSAFGKKSQEPETVGNEPKKNLLSEYVVPKRVIDVRVPAGLSEKHNKFDVIVKDCKSDVKYRLKSESSKEVFMMKCVHSEYHFEYIEGDFIPEIWKKIHEASAREEICTKQYDRHFHFRIFRTDGGNYFQQVVNSDGEIAYRILPIERVQELVEKCESSDSEDKWVWKHENAYSGAQVIKGGVVITRDTTRSEIETEYLKEHEEIVGYEVVDRELYDGIIEVW